MKDYYYILGVSIDSTEKEIKTAYRKLSLKFHPDKNQGDAFFEERFKDINEAYEVLGNQERRRDYDTFKGRSTGESISGPQIVIFQVNQSEVILNDILIVSWHVINADQVEVKPFGTTPSQGQKKLKITSSVSTNLDFNLVATNKIASISKNITVKIKRDAELNPEIVYFKSDRYEQKDIGNVLLTWEVKDAEQVFISKLGEVTHKGSATYTVFFDNRASEVIELTVRRGKTTFGKKIIIRQLSKEPTIEVFTIDKRKLQPGEILTINWKVKHVDNVELKPFGSVSAEGSKTVEIGKHQQGNIEFSLIAKSGELEKIDHLQVLVEKGYEESQIIKEAGIPQEPVEDNKKIKPDTEDNNENAFLIFVVSITCLVALIFAVLASSGNSQGNNTNPIVPEGDNDSTIEIVSVFTDEDQTTIRLRYTNSIYAWVNIRPEACLVVGKAKFKLINSVHLPLAPDKLFLNPIDTTMYCDLMFESIGNVKKFDLVECSEQNCFNIYDVDITKLGH